MSDLSNFPGPYVHVAVDFQNKFLRSLPNEERNELEKRLASFLERTRLHIPTIWVAMDKMLETFLVLADKMTSRAKQKKRISDYGLKASLIEKKEAIVAKHKVGAFMDGHTIITNSETVHQSPLLKAYIDEHHPDHKTLLITGVNTTVCVVNTVVGALLQNYRCIVLSDLLGDVGYPGKNAQWHAKKIHSLTIQLLEGLYSKHTNIIDQLDQRMICMTSEEFLARANLANEKRASPPKRTPVVKKNALVV